MVQTNNNNTSNFMQKEHGNFLLLFAAEYGDYITPETGSVVLKPLIFDIIN